MKIQNYKTTFLVNNDTYDCEAVLTCLNEKLGNKAAVYPIANNYELRQFVVEGVTIDKINDALAGIEVKVPAPSLREENPQIERTIRLHE